MSQSSSKKSLLQYIGLGELASCGGNAVLAFWMILGMAFFLFADQNLIAPNLRNIARSFGITEQKEIDWKMGGEIPIFFFVLGGLVSVNMGYLTQRFSRKALVVGTVLLGEIPCLLSGFAQTYNEFLLLRTLTGFGLGGSFPLLFSILGDYFSDKSRSIASGYLSLAMGLGVGVGQLFGGIIGQADLENGWRMSFIYMAAPSFFFMIVYALFCKEPARGRTEKEFTEIAGVTGEADVRLTWNDLRILFANKTNIGIFLQGIPGCVPWGVFFTFLADYYENDYGIPKARAAGLMTFAAIGIFIGTFLGGIIGQKLYNKNKYYMPIFCAVMVLLGTGPSVYLLHAGSTALQPSFIWINVITGFIIAVTGPNVRALILNVNTPKNRAAMFSLYNLTDDLGKGLGPAMAAIILGFVAERSTAFTIAVLFWIPCGLFWWIILKNFRQDEANVHKILSEEAQRLRRTA
ncbi:transporter, major facilitator family protein [Leptospira broomii serovar Hurstbridge str. 5399]|uniref:Transporter, major facilitator family protein n=1 Tax=Leptospira broomii serovar Hurstbridge str. 5399 TaxID=1049789 RepID=T0GEI0_9LEPT|nr:MFS transporter [Leptospira broomii]EQA45224.1 transporter, major facilitator family protein [Leptospira broomii serovar Hurstbridge str. 5399]